MSSPEKKRTRHLSQGEYEHYWDGTAREVNELIRQNPNNTLAENIELYSSKRSKGLITSSEFRPYYQALKINNTVETNTSWIVVENGVYKISKSPKSSLEQLFPFTSALLNNLADFECIAELGSGWGKNLFLIYDSLPKNRRDEIEFHAFELTESGRNLTTDLASHHPKMKLFVHPFDFYNADFHPLQSRKVAILTKNAIEQIPILPLETLQNLTETCLDCFACHLEPVGWQLNSNARKNRTHRPRTLSERIHSKLKPIKHEGFAGILPANMHLNDPDWVSQNAAVWSKLNDYNTNLVSIIHELAQSKTISIQTQSQNYYGLNPFNPVTVISWSK